jgi:hypothetical protein
MDVTPTQNDSPSNHFATRTDFLFLFKIAPEKFFPYRWAFSTPVPPLGWGMILALTLFLRINSLQKRKTKMAKRTRGARMVAAKKRAAKRHGGKGLVKNRTVGKHIMKT